MQICHTQKHKRLTWLLSPKHQSSGTMSQFHIFLTKSISIIVDVTMSPFSILAWMASVPHTFYLYVQYTLTLTVVSNLFSCCHHGWLVLLVQGRWALPGSIRSTMFMLCCTDVAILPPCFSDCFTC